MKYTSVNFISVMYEGSVVIITFLGNIGNLDHIHKKAYCTSYKLMWVEPGHRNIVQFSLAKINTATSLSSVYFPHRLIIHYT